jgi:hypothetical protein
VTQPCRCSLPACLCLPRASRSEVSIPVCAAAEEGGERRISKAGYDVTPLTLAKQQELAASLSAHQRCTPLCLFACLPTCCCSPTSSSTISATQQNPSHASQLLSVSGLAVIY